MNPLTFHSPATLAILAITQKEPHSFSLLTASRQSASWEKKGPWSLLITHDIWLLLSFYLERLVESKEIKQAILTLYSTLLPKRTYPFVYLSISIRPDYIDVNIHPTKSEVAICVIVPWCSLMCVALLCGFLGPLSLRWRSTSSLAQDHAIFFGLHYFENIPSRGRKKTSGEPSPFLLFFFRQDFHIHHHHCCRN